MQHAEHPSLDHLRTLDTAKLHDRSVRAHPTLVSVLGLEGAASRQARPPTGGKLVAGPELGGCIADIAIEISVLRPDGVDRAVVDLQLAAQLGGQPLGQLRRVHGA